MLTPQQIQEISFEKAIFGGYDMASVDDVLEPLTEDYLTLYKENSVLKSKMRILVEKLEEYRRQESSMQSALLAAQKTSEQMLEETERKCARMLREAEETAVAKAKNVGVRVEEENSRLEAAQRATAQFIDRMQSKLRRQLELLEQLRAEELPDLPAEEPQPAQEPRKAFDFDKEPSAPTTQEKADALIEEIGQSIEESIGTSMAATPEITMHGELPPAKKKIFDDLQFGRNHEQKKG